MQSPNVPRRILPKFITDPVVESDEPETTLIDKMQCALMALQEEINERDQARKESIFERGADFEEEFEISYSSAVDNVTPDEFFQFIWDFVQKEEIFRMIGNPKNASRQDVEYLLGGEPETLLHLLEIALCSAISLSADC